MYFKYTNLTISIIVIITYYWPFSECYKTPAASSLNFRNRNPNIRCPGKNELNIWPVCEHGGRIENPDPKNCQDRYVCNMGLNEDCHPDDTCAYNAMCICGKCQKCESPEKCSEFNMCSTKYGFPVLNMIKKLMQKRVMDYKNTENANENIN